MIAHAGHELLENAGEFVAASLARVTETVGQCIALRQQLLVLLIKHCVSSREMRNPLRSFGHAQNPRDSTTTTKSAKLAASNFCASASLSRPLQVNAVMRTSIGSSRISSDDMKPVLQM